MNREELLSRQSAGETLSQEELDFLAQTEPSNEPGSSPPSTPPTPSPQAPATDAKDRYIAVLEETLRENNRQMQQQQNPAPVAAPVPTAEELKAQFYNDPYTTTESIVERALAKTIAPLNDFVRGLRIEGSPYDRMLSKFKADARFAPALNDQHIVAAVQAIMDRAELTEVNMQSAIVHATGLKSMGMLGTVVEAPANGAPSPAPAPAPSPTPTPSTVLPPHVRPSGPPAPRNDGQNGKPARRQLTENERRVMRENGFKTEEEYWTWLEMPAGDVASASFDKPAPKPKA